MGIINWKNMTLLTTSVTLETSKDTIVAIREKTNDDNQEHTSFTYKKTITCVSQQVNMSIEDIIASSMLMIIIGVITLT